MLPGWWYRRTLQPRFDPGPRNFHRQQAKQWKKKKKRIVYGNWNVTSTMPLLFWQIIFLSNDHLASLINQLFWETFISIKKYIYPRFGKCFGTFRLVGKPEKKANTFHLAQKGETDTEALQKTALDFSTILVSLKAELFHFEIRFNLSRQQGPFVPK